MEICRNVRVGVFIGREGYRGLFKTKTVPGFFVVGCNIVAAVFLHQGVDSRCQHLGFCAASTRHAVAANTYPTAWFVTEASEEIQECFPEPDVHKTVRDGVAAGGGVCKELEETDCCISEVLIDGFRIE